MQTKVGPWVTRENGMGARSPLVSVGECDVEARRLRSIAVVLGLHLRVVGFNVWRTAGPRSLRLAFGIGVNRR